ncbi:MAG: UDP-glucose 4-epimerase GalE [Coriobacteriia bacterium]|nr:UDP-glucose 4-epimerase GalE [Coriobacteriia bacterium]
MNILITGGAGYIGSITTRMLADAGHTCTVLDSLENGHRWAVDRRARFIKGNVGDRDLLRALLGDIDCVMHLAGYIEVGESYLDPVRYYRNNVEAPHIMLREMINAGVDKLVFSSTAAVYGEPSEIPITEAALTAPINPYGESKLRFEHLLDVYSERITSIRFRYFNAAGAMSDTSLGEMHDPETHLIPNILKSIIASEDEFRVFGKDYATVDGTCVRDYIHVCDIARAHLLGIEALGAGDEGGIYNLGNGNGFSNLQILDACMNATGEALSIIFTPPREGDPAILVASPEMAREKFGWNPAYPDINTIIAHAYAWHQSHP